MKLKFSAQITLQVRLSPGQGTIVFFLTGKKLRDLDKISVRVNKIEFRNSVVEVDYGVA